MASWKKILLADASNTFTSDQTIDSGTTSRLIINSSTHNASVANEARLQLGFGHSGNPDAVGYIKLTENATNSFDGTITIGVPYNNGSGGSATRDALTIRQTGDVTFFQHANFPDDGKALFGASNDLQIYHNGVHSYINEGGTGNLIIYQGSNTAVFSPTAVTINRTATFSGVAQLHGVNATGLTDYLSIRPSGTSGVRSGLGLGTANSTLVLFVDKNNAIGSGSALVLQTGGTDALTINGSQNATFAGNVTVGDITLSGSTISDNSALTISSGDDVTIDAESDINIDANGGDIRFKDNGTNFVTFSSSTGSTFSGPLDIESGVDPLLILNKTGGNNAAIHFQHAGTAKAYFFVNADQTINLGTADTNPALVIKSDGNVGVGTTGPDSQFHIHGSTGIRLTDSNQNANEYSEIKYDNAGNTNLYINNDWTNSNALINFQLAGSTKMVVRGDGNVGIGTTNPSQLLSLHGGSMYMNTGQSITWNNGDAQIGAISGYHFQIKTYTGSALTEKMRITSSGNVGIGTTSPTAYKVVVHNTNEDMLNLHNTTDGLDSLISFTNPGGTLARIQGLDNGGLQFDTGNNAGGINTDAMHINNSGNVGIGTNAVDTKLHIRGDFDGSSGLPNTNPNKGLNISKYTAAQSDYGLNDKFGITFTSASNTVTDFAIAGIYGQVSGVSNYVGGHIVFANRLETEATLSGKMIITSSGDVGIGTANPSKKLEVDGSYNLGSNAFINYNATYPYTINVENTAGVGNLTFQAGTGSTGFKSKIELQGGNTPTDASITLTTADSARMTILNTGDVQLTNNFSLTNSSPVMYMSGSSGDHSRFGWTEGDPDVAYWRFYQNSGLTASITMDAITENTGGGRIEFNSGASEVAMASIDSGGVFLGRDAVGQQSTTELGGFGVLSTNGQRYGNYGWLTFNAPTTNFTASSRGWALTNGYKAHSFAILKSSNASTEPYLTTNGEVGTGTTAPFVIDNVGNTELGANLTVNGKLLSLENDIGSNASYVRMNYNMPNSTDDAYGTVGMQRTSNTTYLGMLISSDSRDGIRFNTANGTPVERMRINATGQVGIGTDSPSERLELAGGTLGQTLCFSNTGVNTTNGARVQANIRYKTGSYSGQDTIQIITETQYDDSSAVVFNTGSSSAERMRITSSGKVGIGTNNPSQLLTISNSSDTNATKLAILGGTKGFTIGKTFQGQSYGHIRPISSGQVMALRLMPNTADNDTYFEIFGHDYETETTNFARGMLILKQSDGNAFQIVSDANGSESVGPIEFVIENNSEPSMSVKTDGTVAINKNTDGVTGALTISNNQASASSSTNEAVQMLFGLSGQNDSGVIRVGKDEDYTSVGATSSFMSFYTKADGTTSEVMRFRKHIGLGIGETNPSYKLDVVGSHSNPSKTAADTAVVGISAGASGSELVIGGEQTGGKIWIQNRHKSANGYDFPIAIQPQGGNTTFGGNVEIGSGRSIIYSPTVYTGAVQGIKFDDPVVTTDSIIQPVRLASNVGIPIFIGANSYVNTSGSIVRYNTSEESSFIQVDPRGDLYFGTNSSGATATTRMYISSAGNVGIGTTSPGVALEVRDTTANNGHIGGKINVAGDWNETNIAYGGNRSPGLTIQSLDSTAGTFGTLSFMNASGYTGATIIAKHVLHGAGTGNMDTQLHFGTRGIHNPQSGAHNVSAMVIDEDGLVGIGKDNPTQALDVQGSIISSGVLLAPTYATFIHSFTDNLGTTGHFIPWNSSAETTGNDFSSTSFVVPMNMTLKRLYVRVETISNIGSHTLTASLISKPDGSISNTTVATASKSLNAASSGRNQKFTDSQFSNPPTLTRGQMGSIKLQFGSDIGGSTDFFITSVWEMDNNTI